MVFTTNSEELWLDCGKNTSNSKMNPTNIWTACLEPLCLWIMQYCTKEMFSVNLLCSWSECKKSTSFKILLGLFSTLTYLTKKQVSKKLSNIKINKSWNTQGILVWKGGVTLINLPVTLSLYMHVLKKVLINCL